MSGLQNKMYNYEVTPPANSWEKIAAALDEESVHNKFPSKLYNMEVSPPASAWEAISTSLYETDEKVVPIRRKAPMFFRYAAAAILIGVVAFGVFKLTSPEKRNDSIATNNQENVTDSGQTTVPPNEGNLTATNEDTEKDHPLEESKKMVASLDKSIKSSVSNALQKSYEETPESKDESMYEAQTSNIADRYIMLMTPDGNFIRVSKKLSDLVCCVSGEEQDPDCKNQIKKWQEKIAMAPIAPSPDNFMDILSLVTSLDEGIDL